MRKSLANRKRQTEKYRDGELHDGAPTYVYNEKLGRKMKVRNEYRFRDTPELRRWDEDERRLKVLPRKLKEVSERFSDVYPSLKISERVSFLLAEKIRVLKEYPLNQWGDDELKNVIKELDVVLRFQDELRTELKMRSA
jgi:hypothetical protein